jgi:lysozyme family protein
MPDTTKQDLFTEAINFVWEPSNDGQPFHVTAFDPGGATAWGMTFETWAAWQKLHGEPATIGIFRAMAKADFLPLYRTMFWNACCCGALGPIGISVFDAAVNCGPSRAAKFLQCVLGVTVDGFIGPKTIAAALADDQRLLARRMCSARDAFYATLNNARYFERGWDARAEACRDLVLSILPAAQTWPPVDPTAPPAPVHQSE